MAPMAADTGRKECRGGVCAILAFLTGVAHTGRPRVQGPCRRK